MSSVLVVEDDRATRAYLTEVLKANGFDVATAGDGAMALRQLRKRGFDAMLLDVWLPKLNGLEVLAQVRAGAAGRARPRVVVMTSDEAPETLLRAVREEAYQYVTKPLRPQELLEVLRKALAAPPTSPPIQVISARPHWVELLVPCELDAAERIQGLMTRLKADLPDDVRESVGRVFRELLLNAIEWGGELDPSRYVRIAYLRAKRMLLYRISDPGKGFRFEDLAHAAVGNPTDQPYQHVLVREEKGMRSGGFGLLLAREMVDELLYNEVQNEVVFVKYLD